MDQFTVKILHERMQAQVVNGLLIVEVPAWQVDPAEQFFGLTTAPLTYVAGQTVGWTPDLLHPVKRQPAFASWGPSDVAWEYHIERDVFDAVHEWLRRTVANSNTSKDAAGIERIGDLHVYTGSI